MQFDSYHPSQVDVAPQIWTGARVREPFDPDPAPGDIRELDINELRKKANYAFGPLSDALVAA